MAYMRYSIYAVAHKNGAIWVNRGQLGFVTIRYAFRNYGAIAYHSLYRELLSKAVTCIWRPRYGGSIGISPVLWCQKTRVHGLSCGIAFVVLSLVVLIQYRRVTFTDTGPCIYHASIVLCSIPVCSFRFNSVACTVETD